MNFPCTCQSESKISVVMTLSDSIGPCWEDWGVRMWHGRCQSWDGGASVCLSMCVRQGKGMEGAVAGADCPWCLPLLNEVIARTLSICYRGSSSDQGVAMARWTQKGVAWERVQGSGVRVRGSRVTASWTAHKRRPGWEKKEGKFSFSFFIHWVDTTGH